PARIRRCGTSSGTPSPSARPAGYRPPARHERPARRRRPGRRRTRCMRPARSAGPHPAGPSTPGSHPDGLSGRPAPGPAAFAAAQPSSSPSPRGRPGPGAERSSKNPGPPAGATPQPRPAASRSARPAPLPLPAAPRPAPSAPRSGQTVPHTTAAPDTAPPNQTMITNRAPAPTHHRSTGGLTGYEEGEQAVGGLVAAGLGAGRAGAGDGAFLERHVGVQVDAGRGRIFVAEPQSDDGDIYPCVQQCHRGGVPECVRGDVLARYRRALPGCCTGVLGDQVGDSIGG